MSFKSLIYFCLSLIFVAVCQVQAQTPKYSLSSSEVYGVYEFNHDNCSDNGRRCPAAVLKKVDGKAVIELLEYGIELRVFASNGRLVFSWEDPNPRLCDAPSCWTLLAARGVIYPKKVGGKYLPAVKLIVDKEYPYPQDEEDPEGEVTETDVYLKRKE